MNVNIWVAKESGKHFCQCGCGQEIRITKNHAINGIPRFIWGHNGRTQQPKNGYLIGKTINQWIKEQGEIQCQCGCGRTINLARHHYYCGIPKYISGHNAKLVVYPSVEERFWKYVKKIDGGCWIWIGHKDTSGYGFIRTKNNISKNSAHRFSYFLHKGEFDNELYVMHTCDNPACVNPDHLVLGSGKDNMQDCARKGRINRKLQPRQVLKIVELVKSGVYMKEAGIKFGVCQHTVWSIIHGVTWSHVTGIVRK